MFDAVRPAGRFYFTPDSLSMRISLYIHRDKTRGCLCKRKDVPGFSRDLSNLYPIDVEPDRAILPDVRFYLPIRFRMNITFTLIHIIPGPVFGEIIHCPRGNITITDTVNDHKISVFFCGYYSEQTYFTLSPKTELSYNVYPYTTFYVKQIHCVIDSFQFHSHSIFSEDPQIHYPNTVVNKEIVSLVQRKINLKIFTIQAPHTNIVSVTLLRRRNNSLILFAGPGKQSKKVKLIETQKYLHGKSTSFLVHVVCLQDSSVEQSLVFESELSSAFSHVSVNGSFNLTIPSFPLCSETSLCPLKLTAPLGHTVNVTLYELEQGGETNMHSCLYSGVGFYESRDNFLSHKRTDCVKNEVYHSFARWCYKDIKYGYVDYIFSSSHSITLVSKLEQRQSTYSETDELVVVFFYHEPYATQKVKTQISLTHCKTVSIHVCSLKNHTILQEKNKNILGFHIQNKTVNVNHNLQVHYFVLQIQPASACTIFEFTSWGDTHTAWSDVCIIRVEFLRGELQDNSDVFSNKHRNGSLRTVSSTGILQGLFHKLSTIICSFTFLQCLNFSFEAIESN